MLWSHICMAQRLPGMETAGPAGALIPPHQLPAGTCCWSPCEPRLSSALLGRMVPSLTVMLLPLSSRTNCSVFAHREAELEPISLSFTVGPPRVFHKEACSLDPTAPPLCQTPLLAGLVTTCLLLLLQRSRARRAGNEDHLTA